MSNRYEKRFEKLKSEGKKAFIPFTMLGWPDKASCLDIVKTMIESGASALELGIAFSDPVADGPVIQKAAFDTIASGFLVDEAIALTREIRNLNEEIPIGLMVYYNNVLKMGAEKFFAVAHDAGVDGILIVDVPPEEADEYLPLAEKYSIAPIFIVSPITQPERLDLICRYAKGFLYCVSRLGITGVQETHDEKLQKTIIGLKSRTRLPVCVGFGISSPEQARKMIDFGADGVITGSKIIELIQYSSSADALANLKRYLAEMTASVERV